MMHTCDRCGEELKVITVRVPVWEHYFVEGHLKPMKALVRYEEKEEVCDCPRCQGAY